jgi:hypothetical protein
MITAIASRSCCIFIWVGSRAATTICDSTSERLTERALVTFSPLSFVATITNFVSLPAKTTLFNDNDFLDPTNIGDYRDLGKYRYYFPFTTDKRPNSNENDGVGYFFNLNTFLNVYKELIENKKFREKYETEQQRAEREKAQEQDFQSFLENYPDVKAEEIPASVWQEVESGKSLIDAYMKHENKILKQKLGITNKQESIAQRNQENASASIGAIKSNGESAPFYTKEQVSKMTTKEVNENWKTINESMKKW